jgi:hypothetical protein
MTKRKNSVSGEKIGAVSEPTTFIGPLFKDLIDVLKAKSYFFVPFYAALIGFLISKVEYVTKASIFIQLLCAWTMLSCTLYASVLTRMLTQLEKLRLIFNLDQNTQGDFFRSLQDSTVSNGKIVDAEQFKTALDFESKCYRVAMNSMYFCASLVLIDIYFGRSIIQWITTALLNLPSA